MTKGRVVAALTRRRLVAGALALVLVAGANFTAAGTDRAEAVTVAPAASGWLHTDKAVVKTATNQAYVIKAVAWFGMETSNCAPHGLWTIGLDAGLAQVKSMGFNTIRLPFSNECLAAASANSINYAANPTLAGKTPQQIMDIVVQRAKATGLNVILDRHRPDSGSQSELWYTAQYSEARWISDWKALATRYKSDPTVIGVDLHNEPHGAACWGCGDPATDWQAAATRAGNAVQAVNPNLLIVVEGVEKQSADSYTWWGGGLAGVKAKPVVLNVANRVVYSPHDYPASVYQQKWFSVAGYPANLPSLWDANWGYIAKQGIAPILLGEFGSKLETTSDQLWLKSLVAYLGTNGMSFAYWSFNPNSGDTGGLVQDDWKTPQAAKLAALAPLIGTGTPVPIVTPTATPTVTPKPTATPTVTPTVAPKPTATPTVTPKPTATPTATATPKPGATSINATWILDSAWSAGYVASFEVTSASGARGWTISWPDTSATKVVNSWGMTCAITPKMAVTCTGSDWAQLVAVGQKHRVGIQLDATKAPQAPRLTVTAR